MVAGVLDGLAICRMFKRAIAGGGLTAAACISYPWLRDLPEFATDTLRRRSLPTVFGNDLLHRLGDLHVALIDLRFLRHAKQRGDARVALRVQRMAIAGHGLARGTPALHHRGGGIVQRTAFAGFAMDLC